MTDQCETAAGEQMYAWARDLFPFDRSLTGEGVRRTLAYLKELAPELQILAVPSGTRAFDWTVPDEWTIRDACILDEAGTRVVDFRKTNLHVVGYSVPVDAWITRDELDKHLHSLPELPDAIPYVTSYYAPYWGFCLSHHQRLALSGQRYRVVIDSELSPGVMNVGELLLPGRETTEVLLSANVCHPSLANNELSGMVVLTALARWLQTIPDRRFSYRLLYLPETIGAIWYLSEHAEEMRARTIAGFVITCVGDDRAWSFVPSRLGGTFADRVADSVLTHRAPGLHRYSFLDRGSDERQYCSPGIDLPVCSIMRSKYGTYPEYHTSLDDLSLISPAGLQGSFDALRECIELIEAADASAWRRDTTQIGEPVAATGEFYCVTTRCEPQLGKRGLYPTLSERAGYESSRRILDVLAYADGDHDVNALANRIGMGAVECASLLHRLEAAGLVKRCTRSSLVRALDGEATAG